MRTLTALLVFSVLFYFPGAQAAQPKEMGYATESSTADGMYIHQGKPGQLLIRSHILGSVSQQGIHYFPEGTNLLDALLYAGGLLDSTKIDAIVIRRNGVKDLLEYDLEEIIEEGQKIPVIMDGDIIHIDHNWRQDISTISLITGFLTAMTGFTLSVIALTK